MGSAMESICRLLVVTRRSEMGAVLDIKPENNAIIAAIDMVYTTRFDVAFSDVANPADHTLLLQALDTGVQLFAVNDKCQPVLYKNIQFDSISMELGTPLTDWLKEQKDWLSGWGRLVVVHYAPQAAVVPAALYSVDNGKELLDIQFGDLFRGTLLAEQVPGRNDYTIYRIPTTLYQELSAIHLKVQHRHLFSLWMAWLDKQHASANGDVYLLFETTHVAVAIRKQEWVLIQLYEYSVPEDVSYQVLHALEQHELSPQSVTVHVDGWIDKDSALYLELYKYFRNIRTVRVPESMEVDITRLQDQPENYFTPLMQMATCV